MRRTRSSSSPAFPRSAPQPRPADSRRPRPSPGADLPGFVAATLAPGEPIFVGVSGGGDSTALLLLLEPIARAQSRRLIAGIVDHALREGSAADAARAAAIAADLGAEVRSVRLDWGGAPSAAQGATRRARYSSLAKLARREYAGTLFLGHTLDDQAETLFIRRDAGSGPRGLAGMGALAPCPIWPEGRDLLLARPLLGRRRAELRALLRVHGIGWLEDPANALDRYARVRARSALAQSGETGRLVASAARSAVAAAAEDEAAIAWLGVATRGHDTALVRSPDFGDPAAGRALAALAAACGGAIREPSPQAAERLRQRLAAGDAATLAGAHFRRGGGGPLFVGRDPGGVLGRRGGRKALVPLALPAGEAAVWDGRLELIATEPGWVVEPPTAPDSLQPRLRGAKGCAASRWLLGQRLERLLWRGNCRLFTGP